MSEFVLQVKDIDEVGKDYDFVLHPAWLNASFEEADLHADPSAQAGALAVHVQRNGKDEILVTGKVRASLLGRCVRCLADAPIAVEAPVIALLVPAGSPGAGEASHVELAPEDLDRGTYTGEQLVLDGLVLEHLLLECPMQPLCRDDCKGLEVPAHLRPPADFGAHEQGVDPRLAPLLKLKDKVPPNKE